MRRRSAAYYEQKAKPVPHVLSFDTELVLDALDRLARAVGADPDRYAALLRLGAGSTGQGPGSR